MRPSRRARATDPPEAAAAANLRYCADGQPGIARIRRASGFRYVAASGRAVRDARTLRRIDALAIPPAWRDVWICPDDRGHLQATGRDAKARKQYRYHPRWRQVRDGTKFAKLPDLADALPALRRKTARDLALRGLPKRKVVAAVVRLLEQTLIRVGNDEYARVNGSFGLTTMHNRHATVSGATMRFGFRGKSGRFHTIACSDRRLARIVRRCQELPGRELFQYLDDADCVQDIGSGDVNEYLREATGQDFTAKDFRTWAGTVLAAQSFNAMGGFSSEAQARRNVLRAVDAVAGVLGNTRAVCRSSYIHPGIVDAYTDGSLSKALARTRRGRASTRGLTSLETAVAALLREHARRPALKAAA